MRTAIGNWLRRQGLYDFVIGLERCRHSPREGLRILRNTARAAGRQTCNAALRGCARALGGVETPGSFSHRLLDRFHRDFHALDAFRVQLADATRSINRLTAPMPSVPPVEGRRALVFLLRNSAFLAHTVHNYLVGCALRQLGYRVSFVVCSGGVERCGIGQAGDLTLRPPYSCTACRAIGRGVSLDGFELLDLNDFRAPEEEARVRQIEQLTDADLRRFAHDGLPLLDVGQHYFTRYYHGDFDKVGADREELVKHFQAGVRYLLRYQNLLDQVRPDCLCFFNGLFFPECLFHEEARRRGLTTICVERGLKRNTIYLTRNEPACHYRCDGLWDHVRDQITPAQIREAEAYLQRRLAVPEDPQGGKRDLIDADEKKYQQLAATPYTLLFAPVVHDTAALGKQDPLGGFFPCLERLARLAVERRRRLVVRSHPDELLAQNPSHYPVRRFLEEHGLLDGEWVQCLDAGEKWNPYALAQYAERIALYNGTVGIELPALGYEVFNLAASHYAGKGFTTDLHNADDFAKLFEPGRRLLSKEQRELALRYLYYYVFVASLAVDALLDEYQPQHFRLVHAAAGQQEQLGRIRERLAFYLRPSSAACGLAQTPLAKPQASL